MQAALDILAWTLLGLGTFFCLVGGIGLNRFPDFYTRIHANGVTDTLGAGLILTGLMFQTGDPASQTLFRHDIESQLPPERFNGQIDEVQ